MICSSILSVSPYLPSPGRAGSPSPLSRRASSRRRSVAAAAWSAPTRRRASSACCRRCRIIQSRRLLQANNGAVCGATKVCHQRQRQSHISACTQWLSHSHMCIHVSAHTCVVRTNDTRAGTASVSRSAGTGPAGGRPSYRTMSAPTARRCESVRPQQPGSLASARLGAPARVVWKRRLLRAPAGASRASSGGAMRT